MKKWFSVILGSLIISFSFCFFMIPHNILSNDINGLSIIIKEIFFVDNYLFIFIISLFFYILSIAFIGVKKTKNSIIPSFLIIFFIFLYDIFLSQYNLKVDNTLLSTLFGSISYGFGIGLIYKNGFNILGLNILGEKYDRYFKNSYFLWNIFLTILIMIPTYFLYGINTILYSIINIYIITFVFDKVILGISSCKSFYIITSKEKEVEKFILNELHHGVTIIDSKGCYTNKKSKVLLCVIPNNDYYRLKEGLYNIDKDSFVIVSDSYEVRGGF